MENEKIKEIKKIAMSCVEKNKPYCRNCSKENENDLVLTCRSLLKDMLALINELESKNESLLNEKWDKDKEESCHKQIEAKLEISKMGDVESTRTCESWKEER